GVIRILGRARIAGKARARQRIEVPALGALVAEFGARTVERALAQGAVEAADVATIERHPDDAIAVDVHAAKAEAGQRDLVDFRERGVGRILTRRHPQNVARVREIRAPERPIARRPGDAVEAERDAGVLA